MTSQPFRPSCFTLVHDKIVRQLRTEIYITSSFTPFSSDGPLSVGGKKYVAIWDTGATSTAITQKVVDDLALPIISKSVTHTAAGARDSTIHLVHLWLPNKVVIQKCRVSQVDLSTLGVDVLIGMDVISQGDFTISNYQGKTAMSFRMPSLEMRDYTQEALNASQQTPIKQSPQPSRNAPCPCGSGKKYKHCHGKNS